MLNSSLQGLPVPRLYCMWEIQHSIDVFWASIQVEYIAVSRIWLCSDGSVETKANTCLSASIVMRFIFILVQQEMRVVCQKQNLSTCICMGIFCTCAYFLWSGSSTSSEYVHGALTLLSMPSAIAKHEQAHLHAHPTTSYKYTSLFSERVWDTLLEHMHVCVRLWCWIDVKSCIRLTLPSAHRCRPGSQWAITRTHACLWPIAVPSSHLFQTICLCNVRSTSAKTP